MIRAIEQIEHSGNINSTELGATSRRLRVLQVGKFYAPHMGGIETHLQALCGELRKSINLRVVVASDDHNAGEETVDGVPIMRIPTRFTVASAPFCPGMIAEIRRSNADIVHIHLPNPTAILAYLASACRGRLVVTYHSDTVRQKVLGTLFEPWLRKALRKSSAIIVFSSEYQRTSPVLSRYTDRCHVIPHGIALEEFEHANPAEVLDLRRQYGDRLVLSVGRLVYYKGFEHLIRAMVTVRGRLLIIGDGPLRESLLTLVTALNLRDRVILVGRVPNHLVSYYHAANVFALPSVARSEAFGIVQIEAMAAGVPVVNTMLESGVPFVSLHEQTGLTVQPADPQALAVAINRLLDNPDLRRSLGNAARDRARQEFALETMTTRTLALYGQVMKRRPVDMAATV